MAWLVAGLGLSLGFIGVVLAIAYESAVSFPGGVRANDYVTVGRREAESGLFAGVTSADFGVIANSSPEVRWSYGSIYLEEGQVVDARGVARTVQGRRVSSNFLRLLGVRSVLGRVDGDGRTEVAVISAKTWNEVFAADPAAAERAAIVGDGVPVPIVGVAERDFAGVFKPPTDFWILETEGAAHAGGAVIVRSGLFMFGVLKAAVPHETLRSLLAEHRFSSVERRNDRVEVVRGLELRPDTRREMQQRMVWLTMFVALLLALAFVGFVDFLAADHAVREAGQAVRLALGATPGDVVRESVASHAKLGLWIGGVGLGAFLYVGDVLIGMEPFASAIGEIGLASYAIGFGASVFLLAVAFLWSCWLVARVASRRNLFHTGSTRPARRPRLSWVALLLIAASSLLLCLSVGWRYVANAIWAAPLGFAHHQVEMVGVLYPMGPTPEATRRISDVLAKDAAVAAAGRGGMLPLLAESIQPQNRVKVAGRPRLADTVLYRNPVDAAVFDVLAMDLLAGSFLVAGQRGQAVLSRTAALLFSSNIDDVLGIAIELYPENSPGLGDVLTVVGVVGDIPYDVLEAPQRPVVYTRLAEADSSGRFQDFWLVRADSGADVVGLLQRLGGGIEDAYLIGTPAGILSERFEERSLDLVLGMAGAFAFVLALGAVANALVRAVANDARQIGIRYALGATEIGEARRVAADALTDLLIAGVVVCGAMLACRFVAPGVLAVVTLPLVLGVLAIVACVCGLGSYLSVRGVSRKVSVTEMVSR
ncbi:MAG: hypothetical protein OXI79_19330 [Gammaproteobacteria bacterium]|nr:hypothetical protein [Gammaproteobacteria bacterium]